MIWTSVKSFWVNKLSNPVGMFVGLLVLLMCVLIYSNTDVILSKFGFETATNLKSEVTRLEGELNTVKVINDNLNKEITAITKQHELEVKALSEYYKEKEKTKAKVIEINKKTDSINEPVMKKIEEKIVITETEIVIPIKEYDEISRNNIDSINLAYDSFFPPSQG